MNITAHSTEYPAEIFSSVQFVVEFGILPLERHRTRSPNSCDGELGFTARLARDRHAIATLEG